MLKNVEAKNRYTKSKKQRLNAGPIREVKKFAKEYYKK